VAIQPDAARLAVPRWAYAPGRAPTSATAADDLFERAAPLYAFMREHLFRDDTDRISQALWPSGDPPDGTVLLEIGCGPGIYARRLAARHPGLRAVGVDRSAALVTHARARAASLQLVNCQFQRGDALALDWPSGVVDAVVASRLLTVVDTTRALGEISRILRPGGRCILAEPVSTLGTALPFTALRLAGWLAGVREAPGLSGSSGYQPRRLSESEFVDIVQSQVWSACTITRADGYLYTVCQKPSGEAR
jgi:arsenite methyltransferase